MTRPVHNHQDVLRSVERLHRILEAAKLLNSTLDLAELTAIILRIVREEVGVDRGTVFVLERDQQQLRSIVAQGVEGTEIIVPVGQGICGTVAATGDTINIPDAYLDPRFERSFDTLLEYKTKDIYCMPVVNRVGDIVGVLELLNRSRPFVIEDEEFLAGVSVHVGLALENARMHREIIEKRKIEQELMLAREIQENFYPNFPESYGGVQIAASSEMCEAVGGDYLGYFPLKDGRFLVTLGDVSGKGIGAALVMTSLHATCRALVHHVHAIEHITSILNQTLVETTSASTFVTLMIVLVDPVSGRLHYISAGHNPPVIVSPGGDAILLEGASGPPVGLFSHMSYRREIRAIETGSVLVIFTDGVSEAENENAEQFGADRLINVIRNARRSSANEIHTGIRAALKEFVGDTPTHDDATLIVLKFS
ncbi:MAG: SpoIIE family protein phosphatase [Acidobacteria bacterium]|nr:SpoIIE family protein phosphatase [Acidobacteriota bacterium]